MSNLLKVTKGVSGSEQEASFANSTLTVLDNDVAVSIAVVPPPDVTLDDIIEELRPLTRVGWLVEIQIGPDSEQA